MVERFYISAFTSRTNFRNTARNGRNDSEVTIDIPLAAEHPHQNRRVVLVKVKDLFGTRRVVDGIIGGHDSHNAVAIELVQNGAARCVRSWR